MKTYIYFIGILCTSLFLLSSYSPSKEAQLRQENSLGFFETYRWSEVLSGLDPDDKFFQWVHTEGADKTGCRLGSCREENAIELWAELTGANVGNNLAIVFNNKVYSAPMVREAIKEGKCVISGSFSENDVHLIKSVLEE